MFEENLFWSEQKPAAGKSGAGWVMIWWLGLAVVGLVALGGGLYGLVNFSQLSCAPITAPAAPTTASPRAYLSTKKLYVDVGGAVNKPGLYQLDAGSRLAAAVAQAGGFADQADPVFVAQELNLAQPLQDGEKIYILSQAEEAYQHQVEEFCQQQLEAVPGSSPSSAVSETGQISINTASQEELMSLKGIGEKRAADIIAARPYTSLAELVEKAVLAQKLYESLVQQLKL